MSRKKVVLLVLGAIIILIAAAVVTPLVLRPRYSGGRGISGYVSTEKASYESDYLGAPPPAAESAQGGTYSQGRSTIELPKVRKLIKSAELNLEVVNCDETAKKIAEIVNSLSGIIIDSSIEKYQNEAKKGSTLFKVQPKDFDAVLTKIKELGKLDSQRIAGEDVTEEYVDLEARLKNFQAVKDRLLAILKEKARTVTDILEVERELSRVGEQIESLQGRMKYLDRLVELATIRVNYYEPRAFTPEPLNVLKKLKDTIRKAIEAFINVFNASIVVIFAVLPILIWLGIIIAFISLIRALFFRKK